MINKKIFMSGISIVASLSLMGGAAFAFFSSNASSNSNTFSSGTLSLFVDDTDEITPAPTVTGSLSISGFAPGQSTTGFVSLHNQGTIDIAEVALSADSTVTSNPDAGADMRNVLDLNVVVDDATPDSACSGGTDVTTAVDNQVGNNVAPLTLAEFDDGVDTYDSLLTGIGLAPGATRNVCFTVTFDSSAGDTYQGDAVSANFAFTAHQDVSQ